MAAVRRVVATAALVLLAACTMPTSGVDAQPSFVRGIKQKDLVRYTGEYFTCFDQSNTIRPDQINDDYCDCADGSDEPGTSACVQSVFWCENKGAKGQFVPSSRVRDGVCDCCDGSEEVTAEGTSPCANTCEESGRAAREALQAELASTEAGLVARAALLATATETITARQAKIAKYTSLLAVRKAKLDAAKEVKDREEAIEKEERDKRQAEADAKRAVEEAAAAANPTPAAVVEGAATEQVTTSSETNTNGADSAAAPAATEPVATEATPAAAAAAAAVATPEAPAENFPYPAEYAYQAADDTDKAANGGEAAAAVKENFPYPAEYAAPQGDAPVPLEGGVGGTAGGDGETVEPEYIDGEDDGGEHDGEDDDDDDDDDDDHPQAGGEAQQEDGPYVHPGGNTPLPPSPPPGAPTPVQPADTPAGVAVTAADAAAFLSTPPAPASSAVDLFLQSATASLGQAVALLTRLGEGAIDAVGCQKKNGHGHGFDWQTCCDSWTDFTLGVFTRLGDGIIDGVACLEQKVAGTATLQTWIDVMDGRAQGRRKTPTPPTTTTAAAMTATGEPLYVHPGAESARAEYAALSSKTTRLEQKLADLHKLVERDYGSAHEFLPWDGKCFDLQVKQYTYEVCPYGAAKQKEGHSSTSLGTWSGFVDGSDHRAMHFTGGQSCWQGPQRSLTVKLQCGAEDKLLAVEEPSKCVYEIAMQTPAVCQQAHIQRIQQTLEGKHEHDEL